MTLVLASGTVIDTAAPDAEERFARRRARAGARAARAIRDELRADAELAERVRRKFEIKNTTGYRLCAFLDADAPLEIFRRLVVGSEGTLAFVAEAVFETAPAAARARPSRGCTSPRSRPRSEPVPGLVDAGRARRRADGRPGADRRRHNMPGTPEDWKELPPESAALLVEFGGDDDAELDERVEAARGGARGPASSSASRPSSRATTRRSSWRGPCARGCSAWSAGCGRPGPR